MIKTLPVTSFMLFFFRLSRDIWPHERRMELPLCLCLRQPEKLQCHEFGLQYSVLQCGCIVKGARFLPPVLLALIPSYFKVLL